MNGVPIYDPNELSKEELIELLGLGEGDRIAKVDEQVIIFNIDQIEFKAENLFRNPPPSSAYMDSYYSSPITTRGAITAAEIAKWAEEFNQPPPSITDPNA